MLSLFGLRQRQLRNADLREINVDVYFEEQGIHSIDPASEFYITIYGSIVESKEKIKVVFIGDTEIEMTL